MPKKFIVTMNILTLGPTPTDRLIERTVEASTAEEAQDKMLQAVKIEDPGAEVYFQTISEHFD
jgi:hypothetical protein